MTLPTSGALTFTAIATEFSNATTDIKLTDYYGAAANLPASGAITLADFYGVSAVTFPITYNITTAGAGSVTIPTGATFVRVEVWGSGGSGGTGDEDTLTGSGGGAGGYARRQTTLIAGDAGKTVSYNVGARGASVSSAEEDGLPGFASNCACSTANAPWSLNGNGGGRGLATYPSAGGAGGTASGGTTNTTGGTGAAAVNTGGIAAGGIGILSISTYSNTRRGGGGYGDIATSQAGVLGGVWMTFYNT